MALDFTILLNVSQSKLYKTHYVLDLIDAALGALYINANSPKTSPILYSTRNYSVYSYYYCYSSFYSSYFYSSS